MKKSLLFFFLILGLCSLKAQTRLVELIGTPESPMNIEVGESYRLDRMGRQIFSFTAVEDGLLTLTLTDYCKIFLGELSFNSSTNELEFVTNEQLTTQGNNVFILGAEQGKTYLFQHDFTWGTEIIMEVNFTPGPPYIPVTLNRTIPESGAIYSTSVSEGNVNFFFNLPIQANAVSVNLILPNGEKEVVTDIRAEKDYTTSGTILTVLLANTYQSLMNAGSIKEGETFKIAVENVYEEGKPANSAQEEISVTLKAAPQAVEYIGASKEETINSYYIVGDKEGLITLSFTGEITTEATSATLHYGDREAGTYKEMSIPFEINGNEVTINLQGIPLNKSALNEQTVINIVLSGLKDKHGYYIIGNAIGSPGSISLTYNITEIEVNIFSEFMPKSGNIDSVNEVEIWIAEGHYLLFDGVQLTYQKENETQTLLLSKEELRIETDPYSDKDLLVYVPLENVYFDAGEVTIELLNALAINGNRPVIKATYTSEGKTDPNGIDTIVAPTLETPIYNLQGIKVGTGCPQSMPKNLKKGIYILNGEKVINK